MPLVRAAIAIGSNLGDRAAAIDAALIDLDALPGTRLIVASGVLETPALRVGAADPGGPFLNAAAVVRTALAARELLACLHDLEARHGRDRRAPRGSSRTLDLDLLLFGDAAIDERPGPASHAANTDRAGLIVPHPHLHERAFMLQPLAQIAPDWIVPGFDLTVSALLARLPREQPAHP